jgi:putative N-acetyltransferase (TIGR04045 family)
MIFEPFERFRASEFRVKFAASRWEREGAYALRRQVFCGEQGLFGQDDRDAVDDYAVTLVALSMLGVAADQVVGTVRIHEDEPGLWRGSRLAVAGEYRRISARDGLPNVPCACSGAERAALPCDALGDDGGGRAARPAAYKDVRRSRFLSPVPYA